jgi:serine O-acetyltransferase
MPYQENDSLWRIIVEEAKVSAERDNVRLRTIVYLLVMDCGFLLNFCYRIAHRLSKKYRRHVFSELIPKFVMQFARVITGSSVSFKAKLGRRLKIEYGMGVVIGEYVEIGDDAFIFSGVTLGSTFPGAAHPEQPKIGNNVLIGSGAKLLGGLEIGDNVLIGANSVVLKSFGPNVSVAGMPARVVRVHDKKDL